MQTSHLVIQQVASVGGGDNCTMVAIDELDDAHLMRMAGHFGRRIRGWAKAHRVPVVDCRREEDKHEVAEEYLQNHPGVRGLFLILVGRAVATVWTVHRSHGGVILNLEAKPRYINHYSFHILDPDWGPYHHQDVGPPSIRCTDHTQWS